MTQIATLTLNPTIDVAYEVDRVFHTRKIRTNSEFYAPGGGGINVARVFARLGGQATCHYLAGGVTGAALDNLLDRQGLSRNRVAISGPTRISFAALERESGKEFRFVPPGPAILPEEWRECLARLRDVECEFLVASGSLPPGIPGDFYARVASIMASRRIPFVLDSSGAGLSGGLAAGAIHLVTPSIGELAQLAGRPLDSRESLRAAAMDLVRSNKARNVAVTLGHEGALLADASGTRFVPAVKVVTRSAVGAGDSFLAAMVYGMGEGWTIDDAFRFGLAAGAAAVMNPGHDLADKDDVWRLYRQVPDID
ncbi:1-phosphofructokinase family hexose kinase [Croceicoccus sp. F390]|uniref:Phosphofructokinase n=1 Tax=Croceicoccus esteveae TaxID=3075597 RepID=A0ABU2ZH37_9SPHN|nr:1-phosphofructokinase family hexose kinase [Croceicoccus sp. F390]MDT0575921.1 1-phosphofructokinase family hexose kinase [Croceicoccus sp. F390]